MQNQIMLIIITYLNFLSILLSSLFIKKGKKLIKTLYCLSQPKTTGEQKTKPTQASVRELRGLGISPDMVSGYCG